MAHVRRLPWVLVGLALVVAGWALVVPSRAIASLSFPPNKSDERPASHLLTSHTGQLLPPRVISFPHGRSTNDSAVSAAPRFRTRDDATFTRKKRESTSGSTTPDARALRVSSVRFAAPTDPTAETVEASFPGMSYELQTSQEFGADQRVWPPDTQIGVGDTYVVEFVNNSASIWTKSGQLYTIS